MAAGVPVRESGVTHREIVLLPLMVQSPDEELEVFQLKFTFLLQPAKTMAARMKSVM